MSVKLINYNKDIPEEPLKELLEVVRKVVGCRRGTALIFHKFGRRQHGYAKRAMQIRVRLPGKRKLSGWLRTKYGYINLWPGFFWETPYAQVTEQGAREMIWSWLRLAAHEFHHVKEFQDEGLGLAKYKWAHEQVREQGKSRRTKWINRPEEARARYAEKQAVLKITSSEVLSVQVGLWMAQIVHVLQSYAKDPRDPSQAGTAPVGVS